MRCVIYTRKSADETDPQLSSLQVQRDLCAAYIASQTYEGWHLLPEQYDDGGYSGATLKRPALQALLTQVRQGAVDMVVLYKIDRLSRSLRDFLNLISLFESYDVTFVSVTQSLNTATSIGKLLLNVLLSFAQFERDMTSNAARLVRRRSTERALEEWPPPLRLYGPKGIPGHHGNGSGGRPLRAPALRRHRVGEAACRRNAPEGVSQSVRRSTQKVRTHEGAAQSPLLRRPCPPRQAATRPAYGGYFRGDMACNARGDGAKRGAAIGQESLSIHQRAAWLDFNESERALIHVGVPRKGTLYRYYVPRLQRYGAGTTSQDRYRAKPLEQALIALIDRLTGMALDRQTHHQKAEYLRGIIRRIKVYPDELEVTLLTGAVLRTPHAAKLKPQKKPRAHQPGLRRHGGCARRATARPKPRACCRSRTRSSGAPR